MERVRNIYLQLFILELSLKFAIFNIDKYCESIESVEFKR